MLLLIITLRFTCGELQIWLVSKILKILCPWLYISTNNDAFFLQIMGEMLCACTQSLDSVIRTRIHIAMHIA